MDWWMLPGWCCIAIAALKLGNIDSWYHMCAFRFHFWGRKVNWNQASHVRASSVILLLKSQEGWTWSSWCLCCLARILSRSWRKGTASRQASKPQGYGNYDKEGTRFWTSKRKKKQARKNGPPQYVICNCFRCCCSRLCQVFFFGRRRLPFGWSPDLRLTRGPAGNRTTTDSLSATQECRNTN